MTQHSNLPLLTTSSGLVLHHLHLGDSTLDATSRVVVDVMVVVSLALPAVSALPAVAEAAAVLQSVAADATTPLEERKTTAVSVTTMSGVAAALLFVTAK